MRRALLAALLCACGTTPTVTPSPAPETTTPTPSLTASPTATARPLALDAVYGWLLNADGSALATLVRRETGGPPVRTVDASAFGVAVSPDRRTLAYWSPTGRRNELRIAPAGAGPERTMLALPSAERGDAVVWSSDGTGLVAWIASNDIRQGGIDPPPLYSAVRTIDVASGTVRELLRRPDSRLLPFGWLRDRGLVVAMSLAGLSRVGTYLRISESGTVMESAVPGDDCSRSIGLRLDDRGTTILSGHSVFCFDASGPARRASLRTWPLNDPASVRMTDLGETFLLEAAFRPRTDEIVTAALGGATVTYTLWSGQAPVELARVGSTRGASGVQAGSAPFVFRPEGDRVLLVYPVDAAGGPRLEARLVDLASRDAAAVDVSAGAPLASVRLGGP